MKEYEICHIKEIEGFARQIKEVEETTDLTVLRSDKLFLELQKEKTEAQLDVWRSGKPSVESFGEVMRFARTMGFEPYQFPANVDETTAYAGYRPMLERMGLERCCERAVVQLAMCEIGELPKPHIMINAGIGCDPDKFQRRYIADLFKVPTFFIDAPQNEDDKPNMASLNYYVDQLGECIEWAEKKVPGVKYDEARHLEILEMDAIASKYRREIYQLMKHVPCPIGPLDSRRHKIINCTPSRYPNMKKTLEYLRICRDELGERVASGQGPYPEERLRLLWAGQTPEKRVLDLGKLFLERKIAVPFNVAGGFMRMTGMRCLPVGDVSEYGVKLSPLQEEARLLDGEGWGGPGKRWPNMTLYGARDIGVHGIIHYNTIGCTPMRTMGSVVAIRAEKELGIPTLNIEGRLQDEEYMTQEQFEEILDPFIDKCLEWAGKPRQ